MTPHDAERGGQAQATPDELGREEGIEDAIQRLGVHAHALVGDLEEHVLARLDRIAVHVLAQRIAVEVERARAKGDGTGVARHGLRGIQEQVRHDVVQLRGVGVHGGESRREIEAQGGLVRHGRAHERHGVPGERREIDRLDMEPAMPREREHLTREFRGARGRGFDMDQSIVRGGVLG